MSRGLCSLRHGALLAVRWQVEAELGVIPKFRIAAVRCEGFTEEFTATPPERCLWKPQTSQRCPQLLRLRSVTKGSHCAVAAPCHHTRPRRLRCRRDAHESLWRPPSFKACRSCFALSKIGDSLMMVTCLFLVFVARSGQGACFFFAGSRLGVQCRR